MDSERIADDGTDTPARVKARKDAKLLTESTAALNLANDRVVELAKKMVNAADECVDRAALLTQALITWQAKLRATTDNNARAKLEIDVADENQKIDAFNGALTARWVDLVACKRRVDAAADDLQTTSKTDEAAIKKANDAMTTAASGCAAEITIPSECAASK